MLKEVKSTDIDVLIIVGDFNAKIGNGSYQDIVGNYGLGERNSRCDRLLQFCIEKNVVISNTTFQHPNRLLYTWAELLEGWLAPTSVKYHDNLLILMLLNQWLALTMFRTTGPWKSQGDVSRNQIDYLLIKRRHRNSVKQCKTFPGAVSGSDHNPLIATVSVRFKRAKPEEKRAD